MNNSKIQWTDKASNPIVAVNIETGKRGWFCTKKSRGCRDCYSEGMNLRFGNGLKYTAANESRVRFEIAQAELRRILRSRGTAKKDRIFTGPTRVFMCDMIDLWHPLIPFEMVDQVVAAMALRPGITFMVLTKRPDRMREYWQTRTAIDDSARVDRAPQWYHVITKWLDEGSAGILGRSWDKCDAAASGLDLQGVLPNVQLGVSVEDQPSAEERLPFLMELAAMGWTTFVSYEPAVGAVDFEYLRTGPDQPVEGRPGATFHHCGSALSKPKPLPAGATLLVPRKWGCLDGVICGGETGPGAAPMHPDWARAVRDQCAAAGVAFFFKSWGEYGPVEPDHSPCVTKIAGDEVIGYARVGRKRSGRLLDGVEHNGLPGD